MKKDIDAELKKIASFFDVEVSQAELEQIKEQVEFSSMRSSEFSNLKDVKEFGKFYRKGRAGSWKDLFTVEQSKYFDVLYKACMPSDLAFDFEKEAIEMEHAGERIKENLEYAKGQAKEAFGKVFHQDSLTGEGTADKAKAQAEGTVTKGKQQMSSMANEAQGAAQQAKSDIKDTMSK
ncbi:hypothetical protein GGI12_002047 [Dipsacomyces acuminosporus]|nr:hypothetical protein GGI12_002047 [Dipsacomyces acuminosporus]